MAAAKELTPEQQIEALKKELAASKEESAAKDTIIETQDEQLRSATIQGAGALPVVCHEKQNYQVLAATFTLPDGTKVEAAHLKDNKQLVQKLIEGGSGVLQLIEEKAATAAN